MANLNQIMDYLADEFTTETIGCGSGITLSSGTIGTYATAKSVDITKSGYRPIAATFIGYGHGSSYHVVLDINGNSLIFMFYRSIASSYSVPTDDIKAMVIYRKTTS